MATVRGSGSDWQALSREKNHIGPRSKTFCSKTQAELWAEAIERSMFDND